MNRLNRLVLALTWGLLLAVSPAASFGPEAAQPQAPGAFAFQESFWRNLHHMLYAQATHEACGERRRCRVDIYADDLTALRSLPPESRTLWDEGVAHYAATLAPRSLLFDDEMVALGHALSDTGGADGSSPPDIPAELRAVLERAAPVYRAHFWPRHQQLNRDWLEAIRVHVDRDGDRMRARVAAVLGEAWPPRPIVVDLIAYAHVAGAYTSIRPTRVAIATGNEGNFGLAALEILMHESAHGMIGPIRDRIEPLATAAHDLPGADAAAIRPDLWHEILFYLMGRVVAESHDGYVPYADRHGLWDLAWPGRDRELLERHFEPYLAGESTLDSALTGLIRDLASPADAAGGGSD